MFHRGTIRPPFDHLEDLSVPTLVVTGGADELYEDIATGLARLDVVDHCQVAGRGHRPPGQRRVQHEAVQLAPESLSPGAARERRLSSPCWFGTPGRAEMTADAEVGHQSTNRPYPATIRAGITGRAGGGRRPLGVVSGGRQRRRWKRCRRRGGRGILGPGSCRIVVRGSACKAASWTSRNGTPASMSAAEGFGDPQSVQGE